MMMMTIDMMMRPISQIASINNDASLKVSAGSWFTDVTIARYNRTVVTQEDRCRFLKFSELKFETR